MEDKFSYVRCLSWFRVYANRDEPDMLGPDGIKNFCKDIGVEPDHIVMLIIAFKSEARRMGYLSRKEWLKGLTSLGCDMPAKMRLKVDAIERLTRDPKFFKDLFKFAYDFSKERDGRNVNIATAKMMLKLLLAKDWPLFQDFASFLDQSEYKSINKDQWRMVLEFSRTINADLSNYDENGAWPVMFDEFVEWLQELRKITG